MASRFPSKGEGLLSLFSSNEYIRATRPEEMTAPTDPGASFHQEGPSYIPVGSTDIFHDIDLRRRE